MKVSIKRIYEKPTKDDGIRILVDRLWPRGVSKARAKLDLWLKEIAPSNELRKWFGHDIQKWPEFKRRYSKELKEKKMEIAQIKAQKGQVTLLFGAKDEEHNDAVVLKEYLEK